MWNLDGVAQEDIAVGQKGQILVHEMELCAHGPGVSSIDEWDQIYFVENTTENEIKEGQVVVFKPSFDGTRVHKNIISVK